ncbi:hypothetical protein LOS73_07380 [Pseudoalteromonas sp. SCSIO 43210]
MIANDTKMAITYRPSKEIEAKINKLKSELDIPTTTKLIDFLISNYEKDHEHIDSLISVSGDAVKAYNKQKLIVDTFNKALKLMQSND